MLRARSSRQSDATFRRVFRILVSCGIILAFACGCAPTRPPDDFPLQITVLGADRHLAIIQCAGPVLDVEEVQVTLSVRAGDESQGDIVRALDVRSTSANLAWAEQPLILGSSMAPLAERANMAILARDVVPDSDIFVVVGMSTGTGFSDFPNSDLSDLSEGQYLSLDGRISDRRCG